MKELGITRGEWFWDGDPSNYNPEEEAPWLVAGDRAENIVIYGEIRIANKKDAELICDAGNTAQKCGLLPSELLRQRDELREALKQLVHLHGCEQEGLLSGQPTPKQWYKAVERAEAAIKSTER